MPIGIAALKIARRIFFGCFFVAGVAVAAPTYPLKPVLVVVPYPKGGGPDRLVRLIAKRMEVELGQPLRVENRPGMSGILGVAEVARAAPDGYTVGYVNNITQSYAEVTHDRLIYRPDDLEPIVLLLRVADGIAVPADSNIASLGDLMRLSQRAPGRVTYTTPGRGASSNLSASLLARGAGMQWQYKPAADSFQARALIEKGDANVLVDNVTMLLPQVREGKLRVLATTGAQRSGLLPDAPTLLESTSAGVVNFGWGGLVAPAGTPPNIVTRLNAAANKALSDSRTVQALRAMGAEAAGGEAEQLRTAARKERALWSSLEKPSPGRGRPATGQPVRRNIP